MRIIMLSLVLCLSEGCGGGDECRRFSGRVMEFWIEKHNHFKEPSDVWGNYTLNLSFEAILESGRHDVRSPGVQKVLEVMEMRDYHPGDTLEFRSEPFCSLAFPLFETTGDSAWLPGFVYSSKQMYSALRRSPEGAVFFYAPGHEHPCLLIDFLQEYALRMARTGSVTGDTLFYRECVDQFRIHARILRDPETGLWSQGRGWLPEPDELSPGAWSRGHGWLMRGMVLSLRYLPSGSSWFLELQSLMEESLQSLMKVRSEGELWPVLLNREPGETYPETSGSGMIAGYAAMALGEGFISESGRKGVLSMVESVTEAMKSFVTEEGEILNTCEGPGPLYLEDKYLEEEPHAGNEHGYQAFLHAFAGYHRK